MGEATTDVEEFKALFETTQYLANIMNNGQTPVVYSLNSDNFLKSSITDTQKLVFTIILVVALVIASIILIAKYKVKGLLAAISNIGFIALTTIVLRYTKVTITLNSIIFFIAMVVLNIIFLKMYLKNMQKLPESEAYVETLKHYYLSIIPVGVVAIIFTFMANATISSVGMIVFWSMFIQVIYNLAITRTLYLGQNKAK